MPDLIDLNTLWNLQNLDQEPSEWNLYVNYLPEFENDQVADVFDRNEVGHFSILDVTDLGPTLEGFDNEVYDLVTVYQPVGDLTPTEIRTHLLRYPSGAFGRKELAQDTLRHSFEVSYGAEKDRQEELIQVGELSAYAQDAINRLDDFAESEARRQYE